MKGKWIFILFLVLVCLCFSGCAVSNAASASEEESVIVANDGKTVSGFFDLNGNPLALESCDVQELKLRTALGWTAEREDGFKLESGMLINDLEVTEVYSNYYILNSSNDPDYHKAVMNGAGYCLGNAEDPFGSFRIKGIVVYEENGLADFYVLRGSGDDYFPFISAQRNADLERGDSITVNGEKVDVQPLPIRIRSDRAAECFEDGCAYEAELSLETISVVSYPQQSPDEEAYKSFSDCYLTEVCSYEKASVLIS